jgi:hypothetical protein
MKAASRKRHALQKAIAVGDGVAERGTIAQRIVVDTFHDEAGALRMRGCCDDRQHNRQKMTEHGFGNCDESSHSVASNVFLADILRCKAR